MLVIDSFVMHDVIILVLIKAWITKFEAFGTIIGLKL
jgi:hypothetical protein